MVLTFCFTKYDWHMYQIHEYLRGRPDSDSTCILLKVALCSEFLTVVKLVEVEVSDICSFSPICLFWLNIADIFYLSFYTVFFFA